ncbi:MAG TPA: hypothetical protein VJY35_00555, partial [Candidatus Eisenbacteria bacterium]|nr:hypothetical protein [Candidatus Eisenbacteria bacterium]
MTRSTPPAARLIVPTIAAILLAMAVALLRRCLDACGGRFVYPLDDSYIHMAIARNFALHGSWGIEPGAFQPASSSPLWTLLLSALVRLFGAHDASALALALACMVALVVVLDRLLRAPVPRPLARGAAVLLLCLAIGLPGLTTIGMEPVLHVLLVTPLAWIASRRIAEPAPVTRSRWPLALLAALTVLTRFETLFVIGALGIVAFRRRRP